MKYRLLNGIFSSGLVLMLSACASMPTSSIQRVNGDVKLAESHIGEDSDTVMQRAQARYGVEPHCETRKVALAKQRKAFLYKICGFNPEGKQFANAPLAEVVYHFVEEELVRVDVRAEGDDSVLASIKSDMETVFGSENAKLQKVGDKHYIWTAKKSIAGLRAGEGASEGNVHVRLVDASLTQSIPWLME